MAEQEITLHLPETVMQRAQQAADSLQQPIHELLEAMVTAALPDIDDVPQEMQAELMRLTWASDAELWKVAQEQMEETEQTELARLSALPNLTVEEEKVLESLRAQYGAITLRKARAYALLSLRGGKPLLANH